MLLLFVLPPFAAAQTIDTMALRAHTRFLAADVLLGRGAGTNGERIAAEYIASELMRIGVQPAVNRDYFHHVPLKRAVVTTAKLELRGTTYHSPTSFVWNTGGRAALRSFQGPLIYVGAGDSTALRRVAETRGRVVVVDGAMGASAQTFVPALIRSGAAGVILLVSEPGSFALYARSRGDARYFVDADVRDPIWQADLPVIIAGPDLSLQLGGHPRFATFDDTVKVELAVDVEDVRSVNVVGVLPGSDPALRHEYVAFSAHYDHLGVSTADARGDTIYNGFSDNAAGVAMLLTIADALQRDRPARSILFLFFTAEERGLLGSSHYAQYPMIPLEQLAALINLDAGAPPAAPLEWRIAGGTASTLGAVADSIARSRGWSAALGTAAPNSDYWPFLSRGVPSIFIIPGATWENVSGDAQTVLRARWDRYHRADDEWADDFPFAGLQRYAEYAYLVGRAAANAPARPTLK